MSVRVETLGTLAVRQDGRLLHEVPRKPVQAALLVYLAVERSTTRDEVQALLWPDSSQERARRSLNNTLYELRSLLGAESIRGSGDVLEAAEWLVTDVGEHEAAKAVERPAGNPRASTRRRRPPADSPRHWGSIGHPSSTATTSPPPRASSSGWTACAPESQSASGRFGRSW